MTTTNINYISEGGVNLPTLLAEAKKHYELCDVAHDGTITITNRASIIKCGTYSAYINEASVKVIFKITDVLDSDGKLKYWPLYGDFPCREKPELVKKLSSELMLNENAKCAFYYGRWQTGGYNLRESASLIGHNVFVIDASRPTHILFVSDEQLGRGGYIYNCDVIEARTFSALPIPIRTAKYLLR